MTSQCATGPSYCLEADRGGHHQATEPSLEYLRVWNGEPARVRNNALPEREFRTWLRHVHRWQCEETGSCHYVYVLCSPERVPIYVGYSKTKARPFNHRLRASSRNWRLWQEIRHIERDGREILYDVDFVASSEGEALDREGFLVDHYGRKDDGPKGILCNLRDGGNRPQRFTADTLRRRGRTLEGPFVEIWNHWFADVPGIRSKSIPIDYDKPTMRCSPPRAGGDERKRSFKNTRQPRLFAALALSAHMNKVILRPGCRVPRRMILKEKEVYLGYGVCNPILEQPGVRLCDGRHAKDQQFELSARFIARMIDILGAPLLRKMGVLPKIWRLHRHWPTLHPE